MKYTGIIVLLVGLTFTACNQNSPKAPVPHKQSEALNNSEILGDKEQMQSLTRGELIRSDPEDLGDKEQIQQLIRKVLIWSDSEESIGVLPMLRDDKDSIYIGFNIEKHKLNLDKLRKTGFFTSEFIENYNQIILTLDQGLRTGKYEQWLVGYLPTFRFNNDVNPWCLCQDNLPWENVEVEIVKLNSDKGELKWNWGKLEPYVDSSWKEFSYQFAVRKEDNKWKITYLEGFDFKESIKRDGELL